MKHHAVTEIFTILTKNSWLLNTQSHLVLITVSSDGYSKESGLIG